MFLLGLEVALRITGWMKVYSELTGFWYSSYWNLKKDSWFHTWTPNTDFDYKQKEFTIPYEINSLGFREREFSEDKDSNTVRIICIGDSYTEGDGVRYEESYPRYLERNLQTKCVSINVEVMNAGVSGSDIIYMHRLLDHKLLNYNPDVVIVGINTSDVTDIIQRGGYERFKDDGTTHFKKGPWFHIFFKASHVFRLVIRKVIRMDHMFIKKKKIPEVHQRVNHMIDDAVRNIRTLCQENNVRVVFFITPDLWTTNIRDNPETTLGILPDDEYYNRFSRLSYMDTPNDEDFFNLWMPLVDTLQKLEFESFAWPFNGHFNSFGYSIVANYLEAAILEYDPDFFCIKKTQLP